MNMRIVLGAAGFGGAAIVLGQIGVGASTQLGIQDRASEVTAVETQFDPAGTYPDVYCLKIEGISNWSDGTYRAYSIGTTSCNEGTSALIWNGANNQHPVIGQNLYRYKLDEDGHGRFEQIGQGWLKHGFCALDNFECGSCPNPTGCISLAPACSDPYTAARNGSQGPAGPKWQVNGSSGIFPYPPANPSWSGSTDRRTRARMADVESQPAGTRFFIEAQYLHFQDSAASGQGTNEDNASYRELSLTSTGFAQGFVGLTVAKLPGILAWPQIDNQVQHTLKRITGEGALRIAWRVWDNGNGTWDYEYAIYNLDFDRGVQALTLPLDPEGVTISKIGFHDVDYHSGDGNGNVNFSGADWGFVGDTGADTVGWATQAYATNQNANAIRWGTQYNFRFRADAPPGPVDATLAFFKPGSPTTTTVSLTGPVIVPPCPADLDGSGDVGFSDILQLLSVWGACGGCPEDLDGSGFADFADLLVILGEWGPC